MNLFFVLQRFGLTFRKEGAAKEARIFRSIRRLSRMVALACGQSNRDDDLSCMSVLNGANR